jgi:transcriptional regulator with XRE-family HTH domain
MDLPSKLAKLCRERGWDQAGLARAVEQATGEPISKASINAWFNGKGQPNLRSGLLVARTLGVLLDYLADDAMDEQPGESDRDRKIREIVDAIGPVEAWRRLIRVPDEDFEIEAEMPDDPGRLGEIRTCLQVIEHHVPRLTRLEEIVASVERLADQATSIEVAAYLDHAIRSDDPETFEDQDETSIVADLVKRRELIRRLWSVVTRLEQGGISA